MPTFFDTIPRSFAAVTVTEKNEIDVATFLEATESMLKLFDLLGSTAFAPVKSDMVQLTLKFRLEI